MASTEMDSFENLLALYEIERQIFNRMIFIIGMEPEATTMVIGLWLSLEWVGHMNILQKLATENDATLSLVAAEALAALAYIESEEITNPSLTLLPMMSNMLNRVFTLQHFYDNKFIFRQGIGLILEGVCNLIFRDILDKRGVQPLNRGYLVQPVTPSPVQPLPPPPSGGPACAGLTVGSSVPRPQSMAALPTQTTQSNLNPMARPFIPEMATQLVHQRILFVTFSYGNPLTEQEIHDFFTGIHGDCVEEVFVHQPNRGGPTLFGKVKFRSVTTVERVMKGFEVIKLNAAGKSLWCRRFDARNQGRWRRGEGVL